MRDYLSGISLLFLVCTILSGCSASAPPTVFEPASSDSVFSFYQNGYALGSVKLDSCRVVAELEVGKNLRTYPPYMRLWLLYYNTSGTPYYFDPMKDVKITTPGEDGKSLALATVPPYKILDMIKNEEEVALIAQAIGGVADAVLTKPTMYTNTRTNEQVQVNDTGEKRQLSIDRASANMASTATIYELYKQSIVTGILRRNTIFPQQGVTGYIYFKAPYGANPMHRSYIVEISTQNGTVKLDFKPVAGE